MVFFINLHMLQTILDGCYIKVAGRNDYSLFILLQFNHLTELKAFRPLLCIHNCVDEISPLNFIMIMDMPEDSPFFSSDNFRLVADGVWLGTLFLNML